MPSCSNGKSSECQRGKGEEGMLAVSEALTEYIAGLRELQVKRSIRFQCTDQKTNINFVPFQ